MGKVAFLNRLFQVTALGATVLLATGGCTKPTSSKVMNIGSSPAIYAPTVLKVESHPITAVNAASRRLALIKKSAVPPMVSSKVTFDKSAILNRVFLYGSDLQYSSVGEESGMLLQALALGHVTAKFQIFEDRLQLVAEEKYRFESNINIPVRLLHEWPIVAQSPASVTVEMTKASPTLSTAIDPALQIRSSWVRSVEFVPQGSYLMIESSIELADGKVAEFMESLFPRDTLVNSSTSRILADPSFNPNAARYGFLASQVWTDMPEGRVQTAVAQRFSTPAAGTTIDWYVTANIPTEFISPVQEAVEGWNRYSQKMWGRDFIKFKGVLPAGVKIGDPRYNVISWDSVLNASAAYESQAADPETGIQSHSLIYLPYAWVNIGREFWQRGQLTEDKTSTLKSALAKAEFLGKKVDVRCFNEASLGAITPHMKIDPDTFSKALLRGTLFHEVGHALGLDHNFKGSLEWDPDSTGSMFSSSIMDYNHYDIENGAFNAPTGTAGPLLEYDRQIISVLYNDGKDVSSVDRVLPTCNDEVADSKAGGVDPFCIRYDSGKDPSVVLERTLKLIQDPTATLGKRKSLASAAKSSLVYLGAPDKIASESDLLEVQNAFRAQLLGLIQYYVSAGAQGLNYMMSANLRDLAVFKAGSVPSNVDPVALRARIATSMDEVMTLEHFSSATRAVFAAMGNDLRDWLQLTPWYATATPAEATAKATAMNKLALDALNTVENVILPNVRIRQITGLVRSTTAPFFFGTSVDYEAKALSWLEAVLVQTLPSGANYTIGERITAATVLNSFKTLPKAAVIRSAAAAKVDAEIQTATSAEQREALRALLLLLQ